MPSAVLPWTLKLQTQLRAVLAAMVAAGDFTEGTGEVYNYNEWPASLTATPAFLIGSGSGDTTFGMSSPSITHHNARVWVYLPTFTLAQAQAVAYPLIKAVRDAIAGKITLDGTVEHVLPPDPPLAFYEGPGELTYAGQQYIGIIFNLDVKENDSGTFTIAA